MYSVADYPNIIWIVLDTLREDYSDPIWNVLRKYGFVKYENVIAPAPWTIPSHVSMFTGMYPSEHGVFEPEKSCSNYHVEFKIFPPKIKRVLKRMIFNEILEYNRILISANEWVSPNMGFTGWDEYHNILPISKEISLPISFKYLKRFNRILAYVVFRTMYNWPVNKGAIEFVKKLKILLTKKVFPYFIFVNLMEVHEPYRGVDFTGLRLLNLKRNVTISKQLSSKLKKEYFFEVSFLSEKIDKALRILRQSKLFDNSFIIITSDHGQLLGEYNKLGHGVFLYDELIKLPLYIKPPRDIVNKRNDYIYPRDHWRWVSLKELYSLIMSIVRFNKWELQYKEVVYSEVFSPGYVGKIQTEEERRNIEKLEKHRIAVYHGPYKGIYNVTDGILECVKSYDGSEITEDIKETLVRDAKRFVREAKLKRAVRNAKL